MPTVTLCAVDVLCVSYDTRWRCAVHGSLPARESKPKHFLFFRVSPPRLISGPRALDVCTDLRGESAVSVATYTREVLRCVGPESGDKTYEKRAAGFGAAKIERISAAALPASLAELLSRA